jgi:hypothetical protein
MSLAQIGEFAFVLLSRASNLHLIEVTPFQNESLSSLKAFLPLGEFCCESIIGCDSVTYQQLQISIVILPMVHYHINHSLFHKKKSISLFK